MKGRLIFTYLQEGEERDRLINGQALDCIMLLLRWQLCFLNVCM